MKIYREEYNLYPMKNSQVSLNKSIIRFFLKLLLTNELINEIVHRANNYAIKKLERKVLLLYLP